MSIFQSDSRDISFVVVNNENIIQAFCPCGIYNSPEDSKETSLSFSGSPLSVPIFSSTLNPSTLRKVMINALSTMIILLISTTLPLLSLYQTL